MQIIFQKYNSLTKINAISRLTIHRPKKCKLSNKKMQIINQKIQVINQKSTNRRPAIHPKKCKSLPKQMQIIEQKIQVIDPKFIVVRINAKYL